MTTQPVHPSAPPPPGWYTSNGDLRWWDGHQWTEHTAVPVAATAPPPPTAAPWPTRSPQRRAVVGVALGLGCALAAMLVVGFVSILIVGPTPTANQEDAVSAVAGLAAIVALIPGCLYGSRKYTRYRPR